MALWMQTHSFIIILTLLQAPLASLLQQPLQVEPPTLSGVQGRSEESARKNAPRIFNTVHSAMRQWGSSLQHNGMSFIPATIPANTQLYHGTSQKNAVEGMEWLSFEIEAAENFARPRRGRPPGGPGGPKGRDRPPGPPSGIKAEPEEQQGYLHEYRTKRDLARILYIDGMAAAKASIGTLDTQDYILRDGLDIAGPMGDYDRARDLCALGAEWNIEGFIRMEPGFEIIICNFTDTLELVTANQRPDWNQTEGLDDLRQIELFRGVAARYQGVTNNRVRLDFSSLQTAYFYPFNLTNPDSTRAILPRLTNLESCQIAKIKNDLHAVLSRDKLGDTIDWQGIADMITSRYSERLQFLVAETTTLKAVKSEVNFLLTHFINYADVSIPRAIEACSVHYLLSVTPNTEEDVLIHTAVYTVSQQICTTLFQVRDIVMHGESEAAADDVKVAVRKLIENLNWSTWLKCGDCDYDEVCFVAIWPVGKPEDHERPSCLKAQDFNNRRGYWDFDRGPHTI
ncbi:hypothetical protein B0O99DRAFT_696328 [Bisporella sp. PMI_857]|nr:hypothetical protein B0O99DRAFT_696328 [Bisporella sp. PMI_857]